MTRMIERWFPCVEVSENSQSGWGSSNSEANMFVWFAKRPLAQARAAVLTSLLPWPDDPIEQNRLRDLVRRAMVGYGSAYDEVVKELQHHYPDGARMLDPFCGRGIIPLEGARHRVRATGTDYSPVAVLAAHLLIDYPMRDWGNEPTLPFATPSTAFDRRLLTDATAVIDEVGRRAATTLGRYYPTVDGRQPWGYMWAMTIPCAECANRFPLVGNLLLRDPNPKTGDPGQSFRIVAIRDSGQWDVVVHDGAPTSQPTRVVAAGKSRYDASGKVAVCPFCHHVHTKDVHTRMACAGKARDELILVADLDSAVGKRYRNVTQVERDAATQAGQDLVTEGPFGPGCAARPDEVIPDGNTWTIQATVYGATTYGDLSNDRQTLQLVHFARHIADIGNELHVAGISAEYARALCGYATSVLARKLRRSTRGSTLEPSLNKVSDVFATESSLAFSYDYFEVGPVSGPGSWASVGTGTIGSLKRQMERPPGLPASVERCSAASLPYRTHGFDAVITDPPYDAMIDYSDASDLFFVWSKRSMSSTWPGFAITAEPHGLQEKTEEIIVKKGGTSNNDPRNRAHYDRMIERAFSEASRVVTEDGVVTIVFGHGEPEVWQRLLTAIRAGGLVLTGSWPARTETGGKVGFSNIVTTLTMACRPAAPNRPVGRKAGVEAEVRSEVKARVAFWDSSGLAPTDMLMAAAGPAMEVVGRYSEVRDARGDEVDISTFLPLARAAVQEAMAIEIDHHPLDTFDARTRFALWWVRLFGRQLVAKSELRWQALAASMEVEQLRYLVPDTDKGCRFVTAKSFKPSVGPDSPVIDVAIAMAAAWPDGLDAVGAVLTATGRDIDDPYLWAAVAFLTDKLPDADPDVTAWNGILRNRAGVGSALKAASHAAAQATERDQQLRLL